MNNMFHANGDPFTIEDVAHWARCRRDKFLQIHIDTMNPVRWESMTQTQRGEWVQYRQDLLDIPQQSEFPTNILWPTKPE